MLTSLSRTTHQRCATRVFVRSYFTNGERIKRDDPYAQLGLQYGDGASTAELKAAFRARAAKLHPDVNVDDPPALALQKFQDLQKAYQTLMKLHTDPSLNIEKEDEWRFSVWRSGDRIAVDRTDVAGVMRKRPVQPATKAQAFSGAMLGHPSGSGTYSHRAEYIGDGKTKSSSVGRGLNKWVKPKEFKPWDGQTTARKASEFRQSDS